MSNKKHIIFDAFQQVMRCENCRQTKPMAIAMPIMKSVELINDFIAQHKDCNRSNKLHLQNKCTHWINDGELQMVWCVVDETGKKLTGWMTYEEARVELEKL